MWVQITVFGEIAKALVEQKRLIKGYEAICFGVPVFSTYNNKFQQDLLADGVVTMPRLLLSKQAVNDADEAREIDNSITDESIEGLDEGIV